MQSDRLFINGFEVDLFPGTVIAITYQVNDLAEIKDRQANFSNRFKIPKTKRNLSICQNPDRVQSPTLIPYRKNEAIVIKEGIEVVPVGYGVIEDTDTTINLAVFSGNADFFSLIEGKKLSDLDFTDYDMIWSRANALSTFANTTGIKYPIIQYGDLVNTDRNVDVRNQRTATFFHVVIDKIFASTPFTKSGDVFSNERYLKMLIPYTNPLERHAQRWIDSRKFRCSAPSTTISASSPTKIFQQGIDNDSTGVNYDLAGLITTGAWTDSSLSAPAAYLTIDELTEIRHRATINFTVNAWTDGVSSFNIVFGVANEFLYSHPNASAGGGTGTFEIEVDSTHFYDNLFVTEEMFTFALNTTNITVNSIDWQGENTEKTVYGSTWNVEANLPEDMEQTTLIKTLAQMFGLFFIVDSLTGNVNFVSFSKIIENIPYALDWSDKLHWQNDNHKTKTKLGSYAQVNELNYRKDGSDKDITSGFGNGQILVDDQTLIKQTTLIELAFSATPSDYSLENLIIPIIRKIEDGEFKIRTEPRLLIDNTQDITGNPIAYKDGAASSNISTDVPLCYFIENGADHNLGFNDSLIEDNYTDLIDILTKAKKLVHLMKLSPVDVFRFDHTIPIYLSQHAAYFYVNKIINFTGHGLTAVEMIRIQSDAGTLSVLDVDVIDPAENLELQEDGGYSLGEDGNTLGREDGN